VGERAIIEILAAYPTPPAPSLKGRGRNSKNPTDNTGGRGDLSPGTLTSSQHPV